MGTLDELHRGFSAVVRQEDGRVVVDLGGELDAATSWRLAAVLEGIAAAGERDVVLDLAHVSFVDSAGIGLVLRWMRRFRDAGGSFAVRSPSRATRHLLEASGLDDVVSVLTDAAYHAHFPGEVRGA